MKKRRVYLDYAATTPVDPRVVKAMLPYFCDNFGNTMSLHQYGRDEAELVEKVREKMAKVIGAKADEIIFTGSATESNNLALKGVAEANPNKRHIIISAIEHDCVLNSAKWLASKGYKVDQVGVDQHGRVKMEELEKLMTDETLMVSIIHGNNETGVTQDIEGIGKICRERGIYFHTDASQSFVKVPIDVERMKIDLLTASSHKVYGPKGVALLYVRDGVKIAPILHGGGHEGGLRSSTVNVPVIVGFGKALSIRDQKLSELRDRLVEGILENIPGTKLNGDPNNRLPHIANVSFDYVEGEGLVLELDRMGVMVSTGSACSSTSLEPSHVLLAMGLDHRQAHGSLRFSVGRWTTKSDIDYVLMVLPKIVAKFRKISPYKL